MNGKISFPAGGLTATTLVVICLIVLPTLSQAQPAPHILSTSPAQNELNVPVSTNISVTFDIDMDETTINGSTFVVNARSTGLHQGTITYDGASKTTTFDPHSAYPVDNNPYSIFSGDLDGDGDLDLATANSFSTRNS